MSLPVTVENEFLRLEVYPQFGGKVLSMVDKADEYELLFDFPSEFPTSIQYDQPYSASYCAGWDECFPAVGAGPYPSHPYKNVPIPDHGELWSLPAVAVPTRDGISTEWHGLRFGYRFTRNLSLIGSVLQADYTLTNLSPFEFRFVWAMHALMSTHVPVRLHLPGGAYRLSHESDGKRIDAPFDWPITPAGEDLSQPNSLPAKRGWKIFSNEQAASAVRVEYPTRKRNLSIEFTSADGMAAYWGLWVNTGGWAGHRHFAIQPTTGRYDELERSLQDASCAKLAPAAKLNWQVRWSVS